MQCEYSVNDEGTVHLRNKEEAREESNNSKVEEESKGNGE